MNIKERRNAAQRNLKQFASDCEDLEDFGIWTKGQGTESVQVLKDHVTLLQVMEKHRISWDHLLNHVHTLTPKRSLGSATYDLKNANRL